MNSLIEGIEDSYDGMMSGVYATDEYKELDDDVVEAYRKTAELLDDEEQVSALKELMRIANKRTAFLASKAYTTGVFAGISSKEAVLGK